jgi:hypothetical protein
MIDNMSTALIAPCLAFVVSEEFRNVGRKRKETLERDRFGGKQAFSR